MLRVSKRQSYVWRTSAFLIKNAIMTYMVCGKGVCVCVCLPLNQPLNSSVSLASVSCGYLGAQVSGDWTSVFPAAFRPTWIHTLQWRVLTVHLTQYRITWEKGLRVNLCMTVLSLPTEAGRPAHRGREILCPVSCVRADQRHAYITLCFLTVDVLCPAASGSRCCASPTMICCTPEL